MNLIKKKHLEIVKMDIENKNGWIEGLSGTPATPPTVSP